MVYSLGLSWHTHDCRPAGGTYYLPVRLLVGFKGAAVFSVRPGGIEGMASFGGWYSGLPQPRSNAKKAMQQQGLVELAFWFLLE